MTDKPLLFRVGSAVYLRPVLREDLANLTRWINDPEVTQNLTTVFPKSPEDEDKWFEGLQEKQGVDVVFTIALKEGDRQIGIMGLHGINTVNRTATTGSFIGEKEDRGKGYGAEAKMLLLHYAFQTLNLRKINSVVYATNTASRRCLKKCGYKGEGVQEKQIYRNGEYVDLIIMGVFKEKFLHIWKKYPSGTRKIVRPSSLKR